MRFRECGMSDTATPIERVLFSLANGKYGGLRPYSLSVYPLQG